MPARTGTAAARLAHRIPRTPMNIRAYMWGWVCLVDYLCIRVWSVWTLEEVGAEALVPIRLAR
jgi:hypothetical protein